MKINKKNLICAMVKADLNNQTLSGKAGVSVTQISNIRSGKGTTYDTALKLAKALDVPVNDLIESEG